MSSVIVLKECAVEMCNIGTHRDYCRHHKCIQRDCDGRNTQSIENSTFLIGREIKKNDPEYYCSTHGLMFGTQSK